MRLDTPVDKAGIDAPARIFRRHIFYLPGYDPFLPRRYRELYRKESAAQSAVSGYEIAQQSDKVLGPNGWYIRSNIAGAQTEATLEVLAWADIVKGSMRHGITATYWQLIQTAWIYIASGALFRLMRLRKGPMIAALYPVALLLAQFTLAALAGWVCMRIGTTYLHPVVGWGAGLALAWWILRLFQRLDDKLYVYYLMHDYAFSAANAGANPPRLEERMAAFGEKIATALSQNIDEVLVVGHSSGAHLAISVLADLTRKGLPNECPALAFLSLGQVVPMVSFLPKANRLRRDLAWLSACRDLTWVDVSAPGDGCTFALCDPVSVTGVAPKDKCWPLVISAAFTKTLSPERWKTLRRRFFRLHFQYLCAFDRPGDYDYFQITAGPLTLADRYKGRAPSKSRIETPLSGYRSTE